jgi:hypothetical protein
MKMKRKKKKKNDRFDSARITSNYAENYFLSDDSVQVGFAMFVVEWAALFYDHY